MYISEWQYQSQNISNIRVTTKVAVHSLLSDSPELQMRGTAVVHNLACKEVKTVVCIAGFYYYFPRVLCYLCYYRRGGGLCFTFDVRIGLGNYGKIRLVPSGSKHGVTAL